MDIFHHYKDLDLNRTIHFDNYKLDVFNNYLNQSNKKEIDEVSLPKITDLESIIEVCLMYGKRVAAYNIIEEYFKLNKLSIQIFEICILEDEELSK